MTAVRLLAIAGVLALPVAAAAQQVDTSTHETYRRWDIGGGVGLRFGETDDAVVSAGMWLAEAGRYWTPHVKTVFTVTTAGQQSYGGYGDAEIVTKPATLGAALAYQFLENEFVHPYVSAGARFASTFTTTQTYSATPPYGELSIVNSPSRLEVRPVLGGGFKSYFGNGRAFMRTELLLVVGPGGAHAVLQIGSGVDF